MSSFSKQDTPVLDPQNMEVEQSFLGCLLSNISRYDDVSSITKPEHFYLPVHGEIYDAIEKVARNGKTPSPVMLKNQFDKHPDLDELGGGAYLADLAGSIQSYQNVTEYAKTLRELHNRRILIHGLKEVIDEAYSTSVLERGVVTEKANACLNSLSDDIPSRQVTASQAIGSALEFSKGIKDGTISPIKTGIMPLDFGINGLYSSLLYIVAGRPGMGKTALALNIADNVTDPNLTKTPTPAVFFSLEMPAPQLAMRLLARKTNIAVNRQMGTQNLSNQEWHSLVQAQADYSNRQLIIEDCAGATITQIVSKARKLRRIHGRFVVVIDYLGLIQSENKTMNMVHQIQNITQSLKALTKELDIPIILLSQLSREVEKREDKRPLLSDLRDSGAIEQDADVILFPYRHEYYLARAEPQQRDSEGEGQYNSRHLEWQAAHNNSKGKAEVIVAKNRFGIPCSVNLEFDGQRQLFHDHGEDY